MVPQQRRVGRSNFKALEPKEYPKHGLYKDCTIYAFKLTEEKHRAIAEIMGGEAELELAGTTYHQPT